MRKELQSEEIMTKRILAFVVRLILAAIVFSILFSVLDWWVGYPFLNWIYDGVGWTVMVFSLAAAIVWKMKPPT